VSGILESGVGLGPAFNRNSCAMCHAQPAIGGSSPGLKSPQNSQAIAQAFTCGSEANEVLKTFNALSKTQQQDILNLLRSL